MKFLCELHAADHGLTEVQCADGGVPDLVIDLNT